MTPHTPHRSGSPSVPPVPPEDVGGPNAVGSAEEALVRDFARRFVEVRRPEVEEALSLLESGRLDVVARLGHQIKGTAATFGLAEIGAVGGRLEIAARAGDAAAARVEAEELLRLLSEP